MARRRSDVGELKRALRRFGQQSREAEAEPETFKRTVAKLEWRQQSTALANYFRMRDKDQGAAAAYLSRLLSPKIPTQVRFQDSASGGIMSREDTLRAITDNILERSRLAFEPGQNVQILDYLRRLTFRPVFQCGLIVYVI